MQQAVDGAAKVVEELEPVLVIEENGLLGVATGGNVHRAPGNSSRRGLAMKRSRPPRVDEMCQLGYF